MIVKVSVPLALRAERFDTRWFGAYARIGDEEHIRRYWSGEEHGGQRPTWEHLVEGIVRLDDPADRERIRVEGVGLSEFAPRSPAQP